MHDHIDDSFKWHGAEKSFDLAITYYGSDQDKASKYRSQSRFFYEAQGPKWQLVRVMLQRINWRSYEYIWIPDDDLEMRRDLILAMFEIASKFGVLLGQPSQEGGHLSWSKVLLRNPVLRLHFTNFVEIMAPLFRVDALEAAWPTLDSDDRKAGHGMDFIWPPLLNLSHVAVFDATPMRHTRGHNQYSDSPGSFYKKFNIDVDEERKKLFAEFSPQMPSYWKTNAIFPYGVKRYHDVLLNFTILEYVGA